MGFPGGSNGKESACNAGDPRLIPGSEISPGEGNGNPVQCSCLEKSHGQRTIAGYSPQGGKESDMTELHFSLSHFLFYYNVQVYVSGLQIFVLSEKHLSLTPIFKIISALSFCGGGTYTV